MDIFLRSNVMIKLTVAPTNPNIQVVSICSTPMFGRVDSSVPPAVPINIGASLNVYHVLYN